MSIITFEQLLNILSNKIDNGVSFNQLLAAAN